MANPYYNHGSVPATGSPGSSATMRAEFDAVTSGFALLPTLSGFGNKAIVVNAGGTALTTTVGSLALGGDLTVSGASTLTLTTTGATNVTLPTTGTLTTLAGAENLTNKTITAPVLSGSVTGTYTLAGTPTVTAPILSGSVTGTYTLAGTLTITAPILSGSITGTYTLAGTPTITGPAISSPVLSGSVTGTYTLAGTPTITGPAISSPVLSGSVTGTYTLAGTPTITSPTITGPTISSPVLSGTATGTYTLASPVLSGTVTGTYTLGGTPTIPGTLTAGTPCVQNPYTTSTKTTQAHGRAVKPIYVDFYIECLTAEQNFGVGERLGANNFNTTSSAGSPLYSYDVNQVNILSPTGGLVALNGATPGSGVALTAANWKVVATPYFLT